MLVKDLLKTKSGSVEQIIETATVSTAAGIMASSNIGALVVEDANGDLRGLISEREITLALARWAGEAYRHSVLEIMVKEPVTAGPSDTLAAVMAMMTHQRARHVPIISDGHLTGILSIGDILKHRLDEKTQENLVLQDIARWRPAA